jgi:nitrogen fixation/metabolism regulation signal transduction histidine kinase
MAQIAKARPVAYSEGTEREATMFRAKESDTEPGFSAAVAVFLSLVLLVLLIALVSGALLIREYRFLRAAAPGSPPFPTLEFAQGQVVLQLGLTLAATFTLVLCLPALYWLRRWNLSRRGSLRQVRMLAHDILASMDQGVITTDQQTSITSINPAGIQLLGVDFECVGRPLACISSREVPLVDLSMQVAESQAAVRDRDFTLNRAGRASRLRAEAHILSDTERKPLGCVIYLRNVTERMLIEERMRRMERFISLGTLASGLQHEIKNPLTALSIHLQLLEERLTESRCGQAADELVGVLKTEVYRLNGVLDSFRSFASLQRLAMQPTNPRELLNNLVRLVAPQAAQQQVNITF